MPLPVEFFQIHQLPVGTVAEAFEQLRADDVRDAPHCAVAEGHDDQPAGMIAAEAADEVWPAAGRLRDGRPRAGAVERRAGIPQRRARAGNPTEVRRSRISPTKITSGSCRISDAARPPDRIPQPD